ncbi:peroxisome proliferator-activated receptor gamma coactivator 1-beta isoform X2 [Bombina bombina]|uniref:peroxisome proliferator-activated receptor gamma coactivator 1-beta isoform X2 n=1 Tax=Bombina bombina TaxID=8345 RepID=UPI00235A676C|nr:peroxisome proliferator-activated receptor gamma coactivator 1-beta isoform X2 [Bombina bombina]
MADCSTLLDEDLESFVFNYLSDSPKPGGESLLLDFPEIDLSQLDASDFDSNGCFDELQWCNDHSENESSQYSTEDSELLQIIESENDALLAAFTQTLDDIQDDDINFSAFISSGDGDLCPLPAFSPKHSIPAESHKSPESEDELSILKKLLLSPAQLPTNCSSRRQGSSKFRPPRTWSKVENQADRQLGLHQSQNRSCTELQRHLVSTTQVPQASESHSKEESLEIKEEDSDSYEEHSEDESVNSLLSPTLEDRKPQFTCEREKRAVVDLIRYMHTYCLPINKHNTDEKSQHCNSLLKRPKLESTRRTKPYSNQGCHGDSINSKGNCHAVGKYKRTKPTLAAFSILKELLAKDISGDVSKPYRLAKPVYAAFSNSCGSQVPQRKTEPGVGRGIKNEMETTPRSCTSVKKETMDNERDSGRASNMVQDHITVKPAPKQEGSVYAVRRSSRLNPEISEWLCFNDEQFSQTCVVQTAANVQPSPAAQTLCVNTEPFCHEEQVAEVEVDDLPETKCLVQAESTLLEDLEAFERDLNEAHNENERKESHSIENSRCPPLSLSQNDCSFAKTNFEALSVELCGTAGLTPPTTPPYKPTEEDLFKPEINQGSVKNESLITSSSKMERIEETMSVNRKLSKKHPERTELYAHLSRTAELSTTTESHSVKRSFSRSFGDHDYCQVKKVETLLHRKVLKSLDLPIHVETRSKISAHPVPQRKVENQQACSRKEDSKALKDLEIRASLTKHFGLPDNTLIESGAICSSPEYDSVFEDSGSEYSSPLEDEESSVPPRTKMCSRRSYPFIADSASFSSPRSTGHRSPVSRRMMRCDNSEQRHIGNLSQRQIQKRREKAIDERRVIYIQNLSNSISANELKNRFEVFGEILECRVLNKSRGEKYGFITYGCSEAAALSLMKGASLRKKNEPFFHLSYGGLRHFFWTKYTDLDSNAEESSPALKKSKYDSMDFDSLLKEAQRSLHR